jgi:hypothetical protein
MILVDNNFFLMKSTRLRAEYHYAKFQLHAKMIIPKSDHEPAFKIHLSSNPIYFCDESQLFDSNLHQSFTLR